MENNFLEIKFQNELVSSEMQDVIGYRPHWIVRRGNTLFFLILISIIASTCLINYPDLVRGSMKLTATNAPKLLLAKSEGKLEKLLVYNEEEVKQGQLLAFLQSTASHLQVLQLRNWIYEIEPSILNDDLDIFLSKPLPEFNQLGELQVAFQEFQNSFKETIQILADGYYQQKKRSLLKDALFLKSIQANNFQQQQLLKQDYELQFMEYKANETLAKDKIIAPLELNQNKGKVILKEQNIRQMEAQLINDEMALQNKKKELLELQKFITDQKQKVLSEFFDLKSKIQAWIEQYIVVSPENGKVLFASFLENNQLLSQGQELFYIQPKESEYFGILSVSQGGLGKIQIGQKVLARLESYPSNEFGYLTGEIKFISNISTSKDSFWIKVDFPKGLQTTYNAKIHFRNNLSAQAEVITDNRKLIERFLGQVKVLTER